MVSGVKRNRFKTIKQTHPHKQHLHWAVNYSIHVLILIPVHSWKESLRCATKRTHHFQPSKNGLHTFCSTSVCGISQRQAPASPWPGSLWGVKTWKESVLCRSVDRNNTFLITTFRRERERERERNCTTMHTVLITFTRNYLRWII